MKISVSQIKRHIECPMKAHYEYDLLRGPRARPIALDVGSLVHTALEAKLRGRDWRVATDEYLAALPLDTDPRVDEGWLLLAPSIALWEKEEDWEVVSIEEAMETPCGSHTLVGRLDSVVRWNGQYWHLQHKTLAPSVPVGTFVEQQRTDWHECVYQRMAEEKGYRPFGGTILNILRKLSGKRLAGNPHDAIVPPQYLPRTPELVQEAISDLATIVDDIQAQRDGTRRIVKCRSACAGPYRNSLCAYKSVCDGDVEIESDAFVDLEPRYADV